MNKTIGYLLGLGLLLACSPEDRSSEQPFPPVVCNKSYQIEADSCLLTGEVTSSPNSSLRGCGFLYGNDTLRVEAKCEMPDMVFSVHTRRLAPGDYYAVAFAENGIGRSMAEDTIHFTIMQ